MAERIHTDYVFVSGVVNSCKSADQLKVAHNLVKLYARNHKPKRTNHWSRFISYDLLSKSLNNIIVSRSIGINRF